jgi:putative nucleotidyltransferase with HDIG domain
MPRITRNEAIMNSFLIHRSHRQLDSAHSDALEANPRANANIDDAIEGWVRALSRRDQETEVHTRRVTELTLKLARAMDVDSADLTQIRRGALLHDIGKMSIPDSILHKPGPLNDEEWDVMRRHPAYAYEWLAPILALRPALDIPYCHHERWDGTGYPRGLKGEQIPKAARIFAVVDIWDALRSDRPYRGAWPAEEAGRHIAALAGTHLDPDVVEAFLRTMPGDDMISDLARTSGFSFSAQTQRRRHPPQRRGFRFRRMGWGRNQTGKKGRSTRETASEGIAVARAGRSSARGSAS